MYARKKKLNFNTFVCYVTLNILLFIAFTLVYIISEWDGVSIEKIIFHLFQPMTGVESNLIKTFLCYTLIPVLLFNYIYIYIKRESSIITFNCVVFIWTSLIFIYASVELNLIKYWKNKSEFSNFIENFYVNPDEVEIVFKEKKNLIYIYLESMELSFADKQNGGVFDINIIPKLTELAHANIDFSGDCEQLNGAYSLPGTNWTMAALFSLNTGLPLKIGIGPNDMSTQQFFFPDIISLGDILKQNGYNQKILMGSSSLHAGCNKFFEHHGNFTIFDYNYLKKKNIIPDNYKFGWGIEDYKLFEIAKSELIKISKENKPFNFSIVTIDTHNPGYLSETCDQPFDNQEYMNVILCSDSQIVNFIQWIKNQEFYKDTIIIISGDHPTMKSQFVKIDDKHYHRKTYTCIINTDRTQKFRNFSQFDLFATVLSVIGAKIKGDKLGLGVNLFSEEKTLIEKFGYDKVKNELQMRSTFMESHAKIDFPYKLTGKHKLSYDIIHTLMLKNTKITINVDLSNTNWQLLSDHYYGLTINDIDHIVLYFFTDKDINDTKSIKLKKIDDFIFSGEFNLLHLDTSYYLTFIIVPKIKDYGNIPIKIGRIVEKLTDGVK